MTFEEYSKSHPEDVKLKNMQFEDIDKDYYFLLNYQAVG
jgi:hypothetical protein